ncbi:MAG: substrate-binding domain-containing protein [Acidimicrobiia bacterium]|nr:substrate-binding domain-containing protein [Acidimicrobiia bacterium]
MSGWRAALVALLVGGVVLLTGYVVSRPGSDPGPGGVTTSTAAEVDTDVVLACVAGLESACDAAAAVLGVATSTWAPGDPLPERGVVLAPSGAVEGGTVVAESPIVVAGWRTRWQRLELACGAGVDIECVASALGKSWDDLGGSSAWGDFKIGLADPTSSEEALLAWSMLEPLADPSALKISLRLRGRTDMSLVEDLVVFGDSRADVVVTTEVVVAAQFQNAIDRGDGRFEIGYPVSGPWVEYVAVANGRGASGLVERLGEADVQRAMSEAGLRPVGGIVEPAHEALGTPGSKASGPDAAVRGTLIARWEELA